MCARNADLGQHRRNALAEKSVLEGFLDVPRVDLAAQRDLTLIAEKIPPIGLDLPQGGEAPLLFTLRHRYHTFATATQSEHLAYSNRNICAARLYPRNSLTSIGDEVTSNATGFRPNCG